MLELDTLPYKVTVTPYNSPAAKKRAAKGTNKRKLKEPFAITFPTFNDALAYIIEHSHNTLIVIHSGLWHTFHAEDGTHYLLRLCTDNLNALPSFAAGLPDEYKQYIHDSLEPLPRSEYAY